MHQVMKFAPRSRAIAGLRIGAEPTLSNYVLGHAAGPDVSGVLAWEKYFLPREDLFPLELLAAHPPSPTMVSTYLTVLMGGITEMKRSAVKSRTP